MKPLRCLIGLHSGRMQTRHEIDEKIESKSAFVCSRCGKVIE